MSGIINSRIKFKRDTTANWNAARGFIPLEGEIIVYNDYDSKQKEINGELKTILVPNIKIGDGMAYVQDLPFVNEDLKDTLMEHITDYEIHVSLHE